MSSSALSAQSPETSLHGTLSESLTCDHCHTSDSWTPLRPDLDFDHNEATSFSLTGSHTNTDCVACHTDLRLDQPRASVDDCSACHLDVHRDSFAQPCSFCHTLESFSLLQPGVIHAADFPLEGAHLQVTCESCHLDDLGGAYSPLDRDCLACHMDDFDATVLVNHRALGYNTDCFECHTMMDWRDVASFDHVAFSSGYELIGAHAQIECVGCHSLPDGGVAVLPSGPDDCLSCHQADFDHEHGGQGYPTTCLTCHDQFDWDAASDHDGAFFPIFSGDHAGEWSSCATCHTVPTDFGIFTCLDCHEHSRAEMDDEHSDEGDYVYDSASCLRCHPDGTE